MGEKSSKKNLVKILKIFFEKIKNAQNRLIRRENQKNFFHFGGKIVEKKLSQNFENFETFGFSTNNPTWAACAGPTALKKPNLT